MKIQQNATPGKQARPVEERLVLKVPEFADRYGVTPRTVRTWLKCGLPHLKLSPHNTRIPVREGDEWVTTNYYRQRTR